LWFLQRSDGMLRIEYKFVEAKTRHLHLFFYNLFLFAYQLGIKLVARWNPKARSWLKGRINIFDRLKDALQENRRPVIWMHCSSLGEFEQGRPIFESIKASHPQHFMLVTFFSPSGYEYRKEYAAADLVMYLPMDGKENAQRFLDIVQPKLVIWIKYEYWYYYLKQLKEQQVPVLLVSALFRPNMAFFQWYGKMYREILGFFNTIFVQNEASKAALKTIGFEENVVVAGDTRFDRVKTIADNPVQVPEIAAFIEQAPTLVAGSTWPEDEELLDHYANVHPHVKFIIAPHDIFEERLQQIEALFKHAVRYSKWKTMTENEKRQSSFNSLIIDNIGMLSSLYQYATVSYVGGGFGEEGVHNVLEAAVYGKPVVYGPEYSAYEEAIELIDCGGGFSIESVIEMEPLADRLLTDKAFYHETCEAAAGYVKGKAGASKSILDRIYEKRLLTN